MRHAGAAQLDARSVTMSNSMASATGVSYRFNLALATPGTLGSIRIQFCSNTSLIGDTCDPPSGFDASNTSVVAQTGETGFNIHSSSTANEVILSRTPIPAAATNVSYTLDLITNPSVSSSTFIRVLTYISDNGTGPETDAGGLAFATNRLVNVSAEVPPYLTFCIGTSIAGYNCSTAEGEIVDFGVLTPTQTSSGSTKMVTATNADSGYSIRVGGTTLTSGNNTIPAMDNGPPQTGVSQFGINLRSNVNPNTGADVEGPGAGLPVNGYNTPNIYRFAGGEVIASSMEPDDYRKYTVGYIVNVHKDQPGGLYSTTLTYICLANF